MLHLFNLQQIRDWIVSYTDAPYLRIQGIIDKKYDVNLDTIQNYVSDYYQDKTKIFYELVNILDDDIRKSVRCLSYAEPFEQITRFYPTHQIFVLHEMSDIVSYPQESQVRISGYLGFIPFCKVTQCIIPLSGCVQIRTFPPEQTKYVHLHTFTMIDYNSDIYQMRPFHSGQAILSVYYLILPSWMTHLFVPCYRRLFTMCHKYKLWDWCYDLYLLCVLCARLIFIGPTATPG